MSYDISKASLAVLLILAMVISVLSTFTILNTLDGSDFSIKNAESKIKSNDINQGNVNLNIVHKQIIEPEKASVSLQINRNGDY
ncbi:hypothetical protein HN415_07190 [Candidatus Woesearchaeota archaeon]|jgi:hypothetical protein|nr:hypothetical protein [Candidatus Woesearchaeota archaeon]